jgi:hypothetical protein
LRSRRERLLILFFAFAFFLNVGYMLLGFASIPLYYQRVVTQTVEPVVVGGQVQISNEIITGEAAERGLSIPQYAIYQIILNSTLALIPLIVAIVVVRRAGKQWFAWYTAFIIVFLGEYALSSQIEIARLIPQQIYGLGAIFWFLMLPYFYLFPNGKLVPRRALWIVGAVTLYHFLIQVWTVLLYVAPEILAATARPNWSQLLENTLVLPITLNFIVVFVSQVYRYVRVSTPVERQQTKWFLIGLGLIVGSLPLSSVTQNNGAYVADLLNLALFSLILPVSIGIAILRYRLWDIDVIIRRTLVYSVLSAILGLAYFGGVVVLQQIFRTLTGQTSDLAIVASTLAIAALSVPLRRRVQEGIDRRFYRRKYDAAKTLAAFSETVRDEVDLNQLAGHLVAVVQETVQPSHVSLWLRPQAKRRALGTEDVR